MKDWLYYNFDKLLLACLMVFFTCVGLHIMHDQGDSMASEWITGLVSGASGALYILITGKGSKNESDPKKDDPKG